MKNILSYVGIFILFGLVLLPPILRLTLPDKDKIDNQIDRSNYILSCSNERFIIYTSYEEEKVKMIVIKKIYTQEEIENKDNINDLLNPDAIVPKYKDISDLFEKIKTNKSLTFEVIDGDGEVLSIDYSVDEHKDLGVDNLIQKMSDQQKYYEKIDFTCSIR